MGKQEAEMEIEENLFSLVFDYNREGFRHIGERICINLDYHSLVSLKQSCKLVYFFLQNCSIENKIFRRKLHKDWLVGEADKFDLNLQPTSAVSNVKINNEGKDIIVSIGKNIYQYDFKQSSEGSEKVEEETVPLFNISKSVTDGLKLKLRLPSASLNSKINSTFGVDSNGNNKNPIRVYINENENLEKNQITQFDILKQYLIAGNNNGILSIWDLNSTEILNSKQLFGIITGVKCREEEDMIVTSHAGKAFDIGCISVRKMVSPTELTVLWSAYQDVMPVFNFDLNQKYIVTLEWLGTMNMIHVGSASVYNKEGTRYTRRDFSEGRAVDTRRSATGLINNLERHMNKRFTSSGIFNEDFVALGSDDGPDGHHVLLIWDLRTLTMIHAFQAHMTGIFQIQTHGDRLLTRDKDGVIVIWDTKLAADVNYMNTEVDLVLMRKIDLPYKDKVLCIDMDLRRLAVGRIGGAQMFDFWNSSEGKPF